MTATNGVTPDQQPDQEGENAGRPPTKAEVVRDILADNLLLIAGLLLVLGGSLSYFGFDISIPRFWYVFGLSALFLSPLGWIVGLKAKEFLIDPNDIWVVDIDARYSDGALYRFPYSDFVEFEVTDGEVDQATPNLAIAKNVDIEAQTMEGCWRGTLTDRELLTALEMVHVCRGQLEDDARIGFTLKNRLWAVVRSATADSVRRIVETFEAGSLPDSGDSLHKHVDEAIEDHDVDQFVDDLPDVDLDPEEAGLDPEQWPGDAENPQTASVGGGNE